MRPFSAADIFFTFLSPAKASNFPFNSNVLFQIIFNPTSAAELARMPKELQLQILGEFRGLPQQVMNTAR